VSTMMEDDIKRWTAKRKAALVMEIIQGKTTVAEASRSFDLPPSDIEEWVDDAKKGMENALRAKPLEVKEQYDPDGHLKLLHLWPVKLLQAGRSDYDISGLMAMRAAASLRR